MKDKLFEELTTSIRQAGRIHRGEKRASREHRFDPVGTAELRRQLDMTQEEFALVIGVPVATLRNWEQGRREPHGPARALLAAVRRDPEHVIRALLDSAKDCA